MRSILVLGLLVPLVAESSPTVSPEDPRYDELAIRRSLGELPLYLGGVAPLTEARMRRLLGQRPLPAKLWVRIDRALLRAAYDRDRPRRYSTPRRLRDLTGEVAVTCEHAQGRPCATRHALGEIDGSIGYGDLVSGTVRLRADVDVAGQGSVPAIDRAYVVGELGRVTLEIGRDVLVLGPRSRTQVAWGDHAPALDQVRVSTAAPVALGESLRGSAVWSVGRLRDPQRFPGNLVSISRVQLDVVDQVELGAVQLLQLAGEGAASLGAWDFIAEHVRRQDLSAGPTDSSNRRFGGDVALTVPELRGARLYYAVMFEDVRRARWLDAVRRDADHLFGLELAALGARHHGVIVEYHRTAARSHEHSSRTTGMTNAGRVVGSPLGPDAASVFVGGRVALPRATVYPWLEYARLASDIYRYELDGPIQPIVRGHRETRSRAGVRARVPVGWGLSLEGEAIVEHVKRFAFDPDMSRTNWRLAGSLVYRGSSAWTPLR